jgi:hypothetical protein
MNGYFSIRRGPVIACLFVLLAAVFQVFSQTSITINGAGTGKPWDGVGACSGGGGNSRLLIDYPEPQRSEILDYLFKPNYGANCQIVKIEIGGGGNSTSGAEASYQPTRGNINCDVGYEFWLMEQAKARNPNIIFTALDWTSPYWVGNDNFFTTDGINYDIGFLNCAKAKGLSFNYIGGHNEQGYGNAAWWQQFRTALDNAGYNSMKLLALDGTGQDYGVVSQLAANAAWKNLFYALSVHYNCGYQGPATTCTVPQSATDLGLVIWDGEGGSQNYNSGAPAVIRSIVRGYTDGRITAYLNWPLIGALYSNISFSDQGLILANHPWSGHYSVGKTTWVTAHVGQFTQIGWTFIDNACGYIAGDEQKGAYITLKSPNGSDYSVILETTTGTSAQTVNFTVSGGLSTGTVHVWSTNMGTMDSTKWFVKGTDITPVNGAYSLTLQPNYVYTVSTLAGGRGTAIPPNNTAMPLPFLDNFDGYQVGSEAKYLSNIQGDFQSYKRSDSGGTCMRQMLDGVPIFFFNPGYGLPFASIGDVSWTNYTVSVDALFEQATTIYLACRVGTTSGGNGGGSLPAKTDCFYVQLSNTGAWAVYDYTSSGTQTQKASGTLSAAPGLNKWVKFSMTCNGSSISASINGTQVATFTATTHGSGQVGFGILGWQTAQFSNLTVTPVGTALTGVVFYPNTAYGGTAGDPLPAGSYSSSQLAARGMPAKWASSVQIPGNLKVIMYSGDNFTGTSWTVTSNTSDFATLSPTAAKQMTSCKVVVSDISWILPRAAESSAAAFSRVMVAKVRGGLSITIDPSSASGLPAYIGIYSLSGKQVAGFANVKSRPPQVLWNTSASHAAEGLYIVRVSMPGESVINKTVMLTK